MKKYLSHYTNQGITQLLNDTGAFFAFSSKQFNESKKEGTKYVNMGMGLICPKENAPKIEDEFPKIVTRAMQEDVQENGARYIIRREYFNYESHISMDTDTAREKLREYQDLFPGMFTEQLIEDTFRECWREAVDNDLF